MKTLVMNNYGLRMPVYKSDKMVRQNGMGNRRRVLKTTKWNPA